MHTDIVESNLDTLQKYGVPFQIKTLAALSSDRTFLEQVHDMLHPVYFEQDAHQWILTTIAWYFTEYRDIPTLEVYKQQVDKIQNNAALKTAVVTQLRSIYTELSASDLTYVKDEFISFARNQMIKNAVLQGAELLQRGKYDDIKGLIDRALQAGKERDIGHQYIPDWRLRIEQDARQCVPTPWACINQIMDGGLAAGELGTIIAPSGIGKSWLLQKIGATALERGLRVVNYTFELADKYVGIRYDTILSGVESNQIRHNASYVERIIKEKARGELIIKYFPTRMASINHLMAHINRLDQLGKKPDLLIIDYADLMRSVERTSSKHEELGYIYEELRGILGELKVPGWTASQSQRSALQDDIVEGDKIAGAYSKIFTADFVMSLSRKADDKTADTGRIHVIKNRFGPDGMTYPAHIMLQKGVIDIVEGKSMAGIALKQRMSQPSATIRNIVERKMIPHESLKTPSLIDPASSNGIDTMMAYENETYDGDDSTSSEDIF